MKMLWHFGATAALGLLFTSGCATEPDRAARIREKAANYETLKTSERSDIRGGYIRMGFSPEMVYMAMGTPLKKQVSDYKGAQAEYWTYDLQRFGNGEHPYSLQILFQNGKVIRTRYFPTREKDEPFDWGTD
jgi:hypothetical protein